MTETKTNPIFHLLPSLTDVAFLMPLVFLFSGLSGVGTLIGDGDTGWHIRSGDWIRAHMQVPQQDMFSFTKPGQPWFAWEWLWDACFSWIHQFFGLGGVALASIIVICATSALLYKLVVRVTAQEGLENPLVAIGLTGIAMAAASIHWLARPHLFSMLFVVLFMGILERTGEKPTDSQPQPERLPHNFLWTLPLLMILWTNLHGGFIIGIIILGAYAAGPLLRAAIEGDRAERARYAKSSLKYIATIAGCALASLVNPYTYHLHEHIYQYLLDPSTTKYIMEFQPTNFRWGSSAYLEFMLILALAAGIWYVRRKQFTEVLLIAGWGHLALVVVRNVPIFMIVAAPLVARPLVHWIRAVAKAPVAAWLRSAVGTLEEIGQEIVGMERPWRVHAISAVALMALGAGIASPQTAGAKFKAEYDPKQFPVAALAQLRVPEERIFTGDVWGGYLIYTLSPQGTKVYVDGRSDFYGEKFDDEFVGLMNVKYDWEKTLARYSVDTILLPANSALAEAVKESRHWRVTYDDGLALVFRPAQTASGFNPQVSADTAGGGGRDLPVTAAINVRPEEHVIQTTKQHKERE